MGVFKPFECKVLRMLVGEDLPADALEAVLTSAAFLSLEHTGVGYFLTVEHPGLPTRRIVCSEPLLVGTADGVECGYVVFLENHQLTLECHSWGDERIPEDFRERNVEIREVPH